MGRDGWLGIGWPKEYGGQGRTAIEQFIFWDETYRARAPLPVIAINTIGPTIMQFGTDAQKNDLLPKILKGQLHFGVGYTEPGAGTDLASLATRAVRDGDDYVIDGQKIFTTHAHDADWSGSRRAPIPSAEAQGHLDHLVPTSAGFSFTPIHTATTVTYYANVRVPVSNRVGPENQGWSLITSQLNHERITLASPGCADALLDRVWDWAAKVTAPEGGRMLDQPWVQLNLARAYAKLDALKVLNWRSAWSITAGVPNMAEASAVKVLGTELCIEVTGCCRSSKPGLVLHGEPGMLFGGVLENAYRSATTLTFGGGVNEVQRDIIAMAGLGLPRARR
jgi:alkylation response protein AidB-like acyl-CoA dehydrogenase